MHERNKHINYTAEDIRRYLDGKMSAADMNALERAALEDPFLQDALEGLSYGNNEFGSGRVQESVAGMNSHISRSQRREPSIFRMTWLRYAAAACLIGIAVLAAVLFTPETPADRALATNEEAETATTPATTPAAPTADSLQAFSIKDSQQQAKTIAERRFKPASSQKHEEELTASGSITSASDAVQQVEPAPGLKLGEPELATQSARQMEEIVIVQDPSLVRKKDSLQHMAVNVISGKVVNKNNKPVAFASVNMVNHVNNETENIRLLTDKSGSFKVKTVDSMLRVSVEGEGYKEKFAVLSKKASNNNIVLDTDAAPAVASNAGNARNMNNYSHPNSIAEPKEGWPALEEYLKQATGYNPEKDKEGEVVISFRVSADGELSYFKIEQSLNSERDKQAIRIIREGPAWKTPRGKSAIGRVAVVF